MTELDRLGSIDLVELAAVYQLHGHDFLPYPFLRPQSAESAEDAVADRFCNGDLRVFRDWIATYTRADIWVECRVVDYLSPGPSGVGILGHRAGESGFLAAQRPDQDVVDVYALSPYDIGAAVAASAGLTQPGAHTQIDVPGYANRFGPSADTVTPADDDDAYELAVSDTGRRAPAGPVQVPDADVAAIAVVQSRCRPVGMWGPDLDSALTGWVRIKDDGEYLYAPDFSHATPVTAQILQQRIDELVAADVAALRQHRGSP